MNLYGELGSVVEALKKQPQQVVAAQPEKLEVVGTWTLWDVVVRHVGAYHGASCEEWLEDLSELSMYFPFMKVITQSNLRAFEDMPRLVRLLKHWGMVRGAGAEAQHSLVEELEEFEQEETGDGA